MATVTRSSRKLKDDDINNSKKQTGIKDASTSGSTTTDTSGLRRSTRETPTKKQKTSSSSSTRKSERIEKRAPPTPPTCLGKRKSERVEKQIMASPSRTSDKGEKTSSLSSSASKKSKKNSSMDTKISKDPKLKSGIEPTHSAVGRDKNLKDNPISVRAKKKTRLDARTYRAFLTPRTTKLKESGPSKQLNVHDDSFQGDTENTVTNGVSVDEKNVKEGEDNPVERGGKEIGRRCVESRDGDDEESIPVPGRSVEKSDGEKNSCHFSRIPRNHLAEKNVEEGEDNCIEREGEKEIVMSCVEGREGAVEEFSPVSRHFAEMTSIGDKEIKLSHFCKKHNSGKKNVEEVEYDSSETEKGKETGTSFVESCEETVEESRPVSRKSTDTTVISDGEIELSHFSRKDKNHPWTKNVEEGEDDFSEKEGEKEIGLSCMKGREDAIGESSPVSRKSTEMTVISDGEIELSHFSRKDKNHPWTKNVEDGEDDSSEKEGEKEIGLSCMKGREEVIGESSPVSRKSTEMTVISDGEIELSHFSRKDKNHSWTKNVEEGEDDSSEKEGEKEIGLSCMKGREEAIGESSFFSRKSSKRTLVSDGEVKLSHYSRKFKNHPGETSDAKHGDNSSVIVQSTPDVVMAIEITVDIDPMQIDSLTKKDLQQPVLKSISDVSGTEQNYEFCTSNCADDVPSLPCGSNSDDLVGRCNGCSKRLRVDIDLQTRDVCSCNSQNNYELRETSFPEEVCEQSPILISPENGVMLVSSTQTNGADLECSELLPEAERSTAQDSPGLHSTSEIPSPLKKDRAEHETRSRIVVTEEHSEGGQLEISPLVIQKVTNGNACFICKLGEKLLCCEGKGCKKSYHLLCLDPPLKDVPSGIWYCLFCTKKKILSGVHSVSEGVESVWDAREEEVPDCDGMQIPKQKQMQYFVKYRGLAHVHNRWIPEDQLLLDAPTVVAEFKRNQTQMWKSEWIKPQRLLQKRLLMSEEQRTEYLNQHLSDISNCSYEWFVKWSCLGYEHATWELENASFLKSPEALTLKRGYESRLEKPIRVCESSRSDKEMNPSLIKLSKLPDVGIPVPDQYHHLSSVNKLREYWQKGHSAVIIEDQILKETMRWKMVTFQLREHVILLKETRLKVRFGTRRASVSGRVEIDLPFLLISSSPAIYTWEAEFLRLAPSVNVVVYNGNKGARGIIRAVEFYDDGGRVIFQILLSTPDVIVEDLELIKHLGWEAIIIDECQRYRVSKHFEQFKGIITHFKLLLVTGSIKDSVPEYLNLLSLIDSQDDKNVVDNLKMDTNDNIGKLRERFAQFFVCERKSESSKFVEYWVPVRLSEVQLEQYCFSLLTNITFLRSCSKNDPVGALCDILIATKKCCDHPYLVDPSLQTSLTKDLIGYEEYLKVGVNASGKLLFLDKFLSESMYGSTEYV
ncbi:hypothetical protein GIB67_027598 [Kingdonia uniflora]|uniref:Uncharacterized protein n=1 Tax=Kingdonia uniflora TaxID=39325 RepID=A0A7J7NLC8_9MAGN|nr:hypothetical protein GIB67_027598 [Kingdonia uniflora]